jgi:hypothetical protein
MTKKPDRGGTVMISGRLYQAMEKPIPDGDRFLLPIFSPCDQLVYLAASEAWRGGCGPWKIVEPAISSTNGERNGPQ